MQEVTIISLLTLALLPEFARDPWYVFLVLMLPTFLTLAICIPIVVSLALVVKLTFALVISWKVVRITITLRRGLLPELRQDGL